MLSVLIGIAPWNFFCCSAGSLLRDLTNTNQIMNREKYMLLLSLAAIFLLIPSLKSRFMGNTEVSITESTHESNPLLESKTIKAD